MILSWVRTSRFGVDHRMYADAHETPCPTVTPPLTETGRLRLARCAVEGPLAAAASRRTFQVSPTTAGR